MTGEKELIKINQYGHKFFVFNAKDVEKLRCQHRIVGTLSGTLAQYPLQNTFYGLPLSLLPEEVELITSQGWGIVVSKKKKPVTKVANYALFKYFWIKGYYITSGIKFGGNYLLYANDPMCTHSEFIVNIRDYDKSISPIELIGMGRVATNVKKTFVLASVSYAKEIQDVEEEAEESTSENVTCYSLEWAGF